MAESLQRGRASWFLFGLSNNGQEKYDNLDNHLQKLRNSITRPAVCCFITAVGCFRVFRKHRTSHIEQVAFYTYWLAHYITCIFHKRWERLSKIGQDPDLAPKGFDY